MALPWIKLYADLPFHPKTRLLAVAAKVTPAHAVGMVASLFCYCAQWRRDGRLRTEDAELVEGFEFLVGVGFIDANLVVHGWEEHQLPHIEKAERDALRKRDLRADGARTARAASADGANRPAVGAGEREREREKEKKLPPARAAPAESSPALCDLMCQTFTTYRGGTYIPTFQDERAMGDLLRKACGDEGEINRRWANALGRTRFPQCSSWVDLAKHWNAYVQPESTHTQGKAPARDPNRQLGEINPF